MLTVLTAKKESKKEIKTTGHKETSGGDADVCYFDLRDGLRVCAEVQTHQMAYIKSVQFLVYQLYLNKVVKKYLVRVRGTQAAKASAPNSQSNT